MMKQQGIILQLKMLDVTSFDVQKVTDMSFMFGCCNNISKIYCNEDWNTGIVTSSSWMFESCSNLVGGISFDDVYIDIKRANPTNGYFTYKSKNN